MNKIDTEISDSDRLNARRKSPTTLALEILERLKTAVPYGTTFSHSIPLNVRPEVELEMKKAFELWANSWIAPLAREIITKA